MNAVRPPLILAGQVYLNDELNEYLIVTSSSRGNITYKGIGFRGQAEDAMFIERFAPVDPADIDPEELAGLVSLCPAGVQPQIGFIAE